mmetsp:Transcript_22456/g.69490  ORF Transcript_22456/g.69490 Transcript_22456/m.69490 type:complete len:240 (+) Transcript_22456:160-879(+)
MSSIPRRRSVSAAAMAMHAHTSLPVSQYTRQRRLPARIQHRSTSSARGTAERSDVRSLLVSFMAMLCTACDACCAGSGGGGRRAAAAPTHSTASVCRHTSCRLAPAADPSKSPVSPTACSAVSAAALPKPPHPPLALPCSRTRRVTTSWQCARSPARISSTFSQNKDAVSAPPQLRRAKHSSSSPAPGMYLHASSAPSAPPAACSALVAAVAPEDTGMLADTHTIGVKGSLARPPSSPP